MRKQKGITIDKILVEGSMGVMLGDCALLAAILSLEEGIPVEFVHNDRTYLIEPLKIVEEILKQHP